jgi:uncharacterized protein (UPF0297 family)
MTTKTLQQKSRGFALCLLLLLATQPMANAQSHEAAQLLLNYEKLVQFKKILQNMYQGYKILDKGYNTVKDIAAGEFSLHEAFLDELLKVNPQVRNYYRVAEIIRYQQYITREYKNALQSARQNGGFSPQEVLYLGEVYHSLSTQSLRNLDELLLVISAGKLRMSDHERIQAIDRIFSDMEGMLVFLRQFNTEVSILQQHRLAQQQQLNCQKELYGIQ